MRDDMIGFRDDRDVLQYYGLCPDCGYPRTLRGCLCDREPPESVAASDDQPVDPDIPF